MGHHIGGERVNRTEDIPVLLHGLYIQSEVTVKHHHHFDPVQRIQPDSRFAEQVGIVADVLGLEPFQRQVVDDEPFQLFFDLLERSISGGTQRSALRSNLR